MGPMTVSVIVNGAKGRKGSLSMEALGADPGFAVLAGLDQADSLGDALNSLRPDVVLDFTTAASAFDNARTILERGCRAVIGTSGLVEEQIQSLSALARAKNV